MTITRLPSIYRCHFAICSFEPVEFLNEVCAGAVHFLISIRRHGYRGKTPFRPISNVFLAPGVGINKAIDTFLCFPNASSQITYFVFWFKISCPISERSFYSDFNDVSGAGMESVSDKFSVVMNSSIFCFCHLMTT